MRMLIPLLSTLVLILAPECQGGKQYWWMNNPSVFSSGNKQQQQQQHVSNTNQDYQSQNNYNTPSQNLDVSASQDNSFVETECPVGTRCVADNFCNEQAVMTSYSVSLTPAQKRNRGKLIPCVTSGNGGFDVCCSTSSGSSQFQGTQSNNNNQGFSASLSQPQQQQQQSFSTSNNIPTGECPNISSLPNVESCNGQTSNCWSVGQADVDCPNNALCCFDGCVNTCYFGGSGSVSSSSTSFNSNVSPASNNNFQSSGTFQSTNTFQDTSNQNFQGSGSSNFDNSVPSTSFQESTNFQQQPSTSFQESVPAGSYSDVDSNPPSFPTPAPVETSYSQDSFPQEQQQNFVPAQPQTFTQSGSSGSSSYVPPKQQQTFSPPKKQQSFSPPRQQTNFQSTQTFENADTKPFVTCPSAMKCVPKVNCDFNGVMVEQTLNLTPDLELLRVPLIPCINPTTTNIEVCCRDPNYTDPWPDMNNGNNGNNAGNNGNFAGNGDFKNIKNGAAVGNNANSGIVPRIQPQQQQQQQAPRRTGYGK